MSAGRDPLRLVFIGYASRAGADRAGLPACVALDASIEMAVPEFKPLRIRHLIQFFNLRESVLVPAGRFDLLAKKVIVDRRGEDHA